jgi:signal transduction histidine kinase
MGLETGLWRALAVFRVLGLAYAAVLYARVHDEYDHPVAGWLVLGGMAAWTVLTTVAYARRSGALRTWPLLGLDLAVAAATVVAGRFLDDPARVEAGAATLPVVWVVAPVLAVSIRGGWLPGAGAAAVIGAADLVHRGALTDATAHNIVLLLLAGAVVGYAVQLARRGEDALARARAAAAATRERERLARDIHDGVLQVLAFVGRRGAELGGEAAVLGGMAAEQERSLRALVATADGAGRDPEAAERGEIDLRTLLVPLGSASVTVSTPAAPVPVRQPVARGVAAAVAAALSNVAEHAGPSARAWVLLEDAEEELVVSVRDDGSGFDPARLAVARAEGRLGLAQSVGGRVRDLGGTWRLETAPGAGTELELRVPRDGRAQ